MPVKIVLKSLLVRPSTPIPASSFLDFASSPCWENSGKNITDPLPPPLPPLSFPLPAPDQSVASDSTPQPGPGAASFSERGLESLVPSPLLHPVAPRLSPLYSGFKCAGASWTLRLLHWWLCPGLPPELQTSPTRLGLPTPMFGGSYA